MDAHLTNHADIIFSMIISLIDNNLIDNEFSNIVH